MPLPSPIQQNPDERVLHVYLLGRLGFDDWIALQRRLAYDVRGDRSAGVLVLCEHPPTISIGREGSAEHICLEPEELEALRWPVHWVNRGGGCLLHVPGQIACYPVVALDRLGLQVQEYLDRLHDVIQSVLIDCHVPAELRSESAGVWVGERRIAHVGVAISDWVSYFGCAINVDCPLKPFRAVKCDGAAKPMTSIEREKRGRARTSTVRQRFLELFAERFGFDRVSLFHQHPSLPRKARVHAVATPAR